MCGCRWTTSAPVTALAYLQRLPVHEVKIDRSFVSPLDGPTPDVTVLRATVNLAHALGMRVVAERVETSLAWARTAELGCELVQGFGLARPMSTAAFGTWLLHGEDQDRRMGEHHLPPCQRSSSVHPGSRPSAAGNQDR